MRPAGQRSLLPSWQWRRYGRQQVKWSHVSTSLLLARPNLTSPSLTWWLPKLTGKWRKKFIFSCLRSHIYLQYWREGHTPPQASCALWENGGPRVGKKVCTTSVYTWPHRIKTTTLAGEQMKQRKETRIGRVTSSLTKRPDGGIHQWQLHGE